MSCLRISLTEDKLLKMKRTPVANNISRYQLALILTQTSGCSA